MKYRKKPVVIDAVRVTGINGEEVMAFVGDSGRIASSRIGDVDTSVIVITTLEGEMTARIGDWIIRGVKGECYPCKPDIFEATYEVVED